jgi:outer membrane receptor protein involved in Fe transport
MPVTLTEYGDVPMRFALSKLTLCLGLYSPFLFAGLDNVNSPLGDAQPIERIQVNGSKVNDATQTNAETEQLLKVAGIMNDPLAAVFSLPGVVYAGGDFGGMPAVRGSAPDDNALLIDGLPAGYLFHMFGNSVLNEALLQDFHLESGGFGAQYGNATGGVFSATLRDPKNQAIGGEAELSLLQMSTLVEGAINDEQSFYVAARQSTIQYFIKSGDELDDGIQIYQPPKSSDYQARYLFQVSPEQKITLTLTGANDSAKANISKASEQGRADPESVGDVRIDTAFANQQISYQYQLPAGHLLNVRYQRSSNTEDNLYGGDQFVSFKDTQQYFQVQSRWLITDQHQLETGIERSQRDGDYRFDVIPYFCTDHQPDCFAQRGERIQADDKLKYQTNSAFLQHYWQWNDYLSSVVGVRYDSQNYTDEDFLQPRAEISLQMTPEQRWFVRAGRYSRLADLEKSLPVLGNRHLKQPTANHYVLGQEWQFAENWSFNSEMYLKKLQKLPLGLTAQDADQALNYSNDSAGRAHGIELLLKKQKNNGDWYGWTSLSWSKAERTDLRRNITSEYYLDTPMVANMVVAYPYSDEWDFSARLTVRSGAKYTPIIGSKPNPYYPDYQVAVYGELNSETLPVYHRLDLQAEQQGSLFGLPVTYTYAILNVLNRKNVSGYFLQKAKAGESPAYSIEAEENLGMFPSVGLKMMF